MTREEKTNLLNELLEFEENNDIGNLTRAERREFQQWISEALEQEPCEDCISREAVLDKAWDVPYDGKYIQVVDVGDIKELPPVTPARKKGHWIDHSDEGYVECSECGSCTNCDGNIADLHFCFNCGAEMDEDESTLNYADQNTMMPAT